VIVFLFSYFPVPGSSKHEETAKVHISSTHTSRNRYKPKLKQTPSIVINSPPSNDRRAVNHADIDVEESLTQGENVGEFMPDREGRISHFSKESGNKETPRALQQQNKDLSLQFIPNKERESYFPSEKQENLYEYEIYADNVNRKSPNQMNLTENYRGLQRHGAHGLGTRNVDIGARNVDTGARNISPGARIVSPGARNVDPRTRKLSAEARNLSPGTRNVEQSSSSDEERANKTNSHGVRMSPSIFSERIDNPEGFQRPRPKYISQDGTDGSSLYRVRNNVSPGQNSTNKHAPRQIPRQSQSESNLKSKGMPDRTMYPVVKTFSDPVSIQASQTRIEPRDSKFSSETSLVANNAFGMEKKSPESALDRNERQSPRIRGNSPFSRRRGNKDPEIDREQDTSPLVSRELDRQSYEDKHNRATFQADRSKGQPKTGINEASLEIGKHPYEAKRTKDGLLADRNTQNRETLPSERSSNGGRTNNSFQADKGTSEVSAHKDTNKGETQAERPQSEIFGGLLGETDTNHSAEYYDRMISKINEQINLAVSRNKSPYALYGLGSDDDDDWC
jgi:hypothetical protein